MTDNDQSYWERNAKNYDRSMLLLGGPIPRMAALAAEGVKGCDVVLEVAAGTGLVTTAIAREASQVVATDYAAEMVKRLADNVRTAGHSNVRCEQANIYDLDYGDDSFDAVVAANVLHLLPDLPAAFAAFRRVLRPNGRLIVPTYCHDEGPVSWLMSRALSVTGFPGQRRFTATTLQSQIESEGFQLQRFELIRGVIPVGYVEGRLVP